jgi:hypothetical protein
MLSFQDCRNWILLTGFSCLPFSAFAQSRGGSCRAPICDFFGGLIGLILFCVFLLSLAESIAKHGFWKGIFRHPLVQFLTMYVFFIGGMFLFIGIGHELGGKQGGFIALAIVILYLYISDRFSLKKPNPNDNQSDT